MKSTSVKHIIKQLGRISQTYIIKLKINSEFYAGSTYRLEFFKRYVHL